MSIISRLKTAKANMLTQYIKILHMNSRDLLNKMKWHDDYDFDRVKIYYISRGAEGGISSVSGSNVRELERHFFVTRDGEIPYHRITKIEYGEEVVFGI